jgi:phosphoglucosamine mutase
MGRGSVVVGHDTRRAAEMVEYAAISGLLSVGCRVTRVGMVATPTLAYAARDYDCGIMVTASHNPPEYIGVKLFNPKRMKTQSQTTYHTFSQASRSRRGCGWWWTVAAAQPRSQRRTC